MVACDLCQRSWRVVTAIIAWVFIRDSDLDSIKLNVLPLHETGMPHVCLLCSCSLISYSNVFFVNAFRILDSLIC